MTHVAKVLVVEDDLGTIDLLSDVVRRGGYEPLLARGGWEALHLLKEQGADLILLDLMMKGMDGWSLLEAIKADDRLGTIPVIIISVRHPAEDPRRVKAYAGQFEEYMVKPFHVNELLAKMAEVLQRAGVEGSASESQV